MAKYDNDTWEALKQYFKEQIYFTTFEDADLSFKGVIINSRGFQLWYLQRKVKELQREIIESVFKLFRRRKVS